MTEAKKVTYSQTERGTIPVYADQIVMQPEDYTPTEHDVWRQLLLKQTSLVQEHAHPLFTESLLRMNFDTDIPRFSKLSGFLNGWEVVAVNGLLSDVAFFDLLAQKKFPATWWIRTPQQLDYIQEPDLFHDIFGHVPLLSNPDYSSAIQLMGEIGRSDLSSDPNFMTAMARLYWFSIEFGLMRDAGKEKAFGAGLLSSSGEILYSQDPSTEKLRFEFARVIKTPYKIDNYQPFYFTCDNFHHLKNEFEQFYTKAKQGKIKY